jgi:4-amino-4-deoxy-L-arabinose transferase-like glycosyltransferase
VKAFFPKYGKYILLALLLFTPLFSGLDKQPLRIWDEAQLAVNALEMHTNGDLLVTHFKGEPDLWNTKPPFMIWLQVAALNVFGIGEFALRLPSAIAGLLTCIVLLLFSMRYVKDFWFGFIVIMVLITMNGYVNHHVTRTGDYDALLILFTTTAALLFYLIAEQRSNRLLYWFFSVMTLAVLTKGIAALLFGPAMLLYAIYKKQLFWFVRNKHFYFGLAGFLCITFGYYFLREIYNPGYLEAVKNNELGGRFLKLLFREQRPFMYYVENMKKIQLKHWYFVVPVGILAGLLNKDQKLKQLTIFASLMMGVHLLVISISKTKFSWYNAPEFPFIAILIGVLIYSVHRAISGGGRTLKWLNLNTLQVLLLLFIFAYPYQYIYNKTKDPKEWRKEKDFYEIGYFLQGALRGQEDVDGYRVLYDGYRTQNLFYVKALQLKDVDIDFKPWDSLQVNDKVIAHQPEIKTYVEDHYEFEIIERKNNLIKYKIHARKEEH